MKQLMTYFLLSFSLLAGAQKQPLRIQAIGIDGFKNIPFMTFLGKEAVSSSLVTNEKGRFYNPTIGEFYVQLGRSNTRKLTTLGIGYASLEHLQAQRLRQRITGQYLKIGREYQYEARNPLSMFWGYHLTVARTKAEGAITLNGDYFLDYETNVPTKTGVEAGADFTIGVQCVLLRRVSVRLSARNALVISGFGNRNYPHLAGQGVRMSKGLVSATGGATVQLFYLMQPRVRRNSTN